MDVLPILMGLAAAQAEPDFQQQAAQCGFQPHQIVWTADATGKRHANIALNGELDDAFFTSLECMVEWAQQSGVKIGFISEPRRSSEPKP